MKPIITLAFLLLFLNSSMLLARITTADPDGDKHLPYVGEADSHFLHQEYPGHEQIDVARGSSSGSSSGSHLPPCGRTASGSTNRSGVECDIREFNSVFANQEVPRVPAPKAIKAVKDANRGLNQQDFLNTQSETATGNGRPPTGSTEH